MVNLSILLIFGLFLCSTNGIVTKNGKALQFSGISNKIADLVAEAFTNGIKANTNKKQDAVIIGDDNDQSLLSSDNNIYMNGFLKLLGFDGRKIGAAAMNGIIFIAQMVRYGANKFMNFIMEKARDWVSKAEVINNSTKNVQNRRRLFNAKF